PRGDHVERIIVPQSRLSCRRFGRNRPATGLFKMPRHLLLIAVAAALAGTATPSLAFQEQSVGGDAAKAANLQEPPPAPSLKLSAPETTGRSGGGLEVRIPGVGSLGALPKLDFGLELLYGANDPPAGRTDDRSQPSDVQLRATLKHRF